MREPSVGGEDLLEDDRLALCRFAPLHGCGGALLIALLLFLRSEAFLIHEVNEFRSAKFWWHFS
jgi:hypothetical protein